MVATYQSLNRTIFNDEIKEDFERTKTKLLQCVNSSGVKAGDTVKWDTTGLSGSAKTRGRDGNIVRGQLPFAPVSATLSEEFSDKFVINDFDAFVSNPNIRATYSSKSIAQCNRAIDQKIVDTLDSTSVQFAAGAAQTLSTLAVATGILTTLWEKDVPADDGKTWVLLTVKAGAQLMKINEFKSSDFVTVRPAENGLPAVGYRRWLDANWMTFNGLTNRTANNAKCYAFHESALGHNIDGPPEGHAYWYEPEHRWEHYSLIRHAAAPVLPRGILQVIHDDTAAL